jgi:cytochrome P450
MNEPADPIEAVTHPDPYPYYASLAVRWPIYRDERLGMWVAASAAAVTDVLTSDACRVRPSAEPVPHALVGSAAGEVFRRLVRMNEGAEHRSMKPAVASTVGAMTAGRVGDAAREWARVICDELRSASDEQRIDAVASSVPTFTVAALLGVPRDELPEVARWTGDLARCFAPGAAAEQVERGAAAAEGLLDLFRRLPTIGGEGATRIAHGSDAVVANAIGLLTQAYDATAGLIGSTLLALARHPDVRRNVAADASLLRVVVEEVVRHDPPIQNTRRFVSRDATVAGQHLREGDAVLVVLAAANHDAGANPCPERFDLSRAHRRTFTFGAGVHACPGEMLAKNIAHAVVDALLASGVDPAGLRGAVTYQPSASARVPRFSAGSEARSSTYRQNEVRG